MNATAGVFLVIGGFALLLLILSLFGGARLHLGHLHLGHIRLGHFHLGHIHFGHGGVSQGGISHGGGSQGGGSQGGGSQGGIEVSMPVIAGFLGAFGFGGAIVASLLPGQGASTALTAAVVGLLAAVPTAWLTGRLVNAAMNISTDATLTSDDFVGAMGVVITPVPVGGYGEVRLATAGSQIKLNARADQPLPLGTRIFVTSVLSPTSVLVEPTLSID